MDKGLFRPPEQVAAFRASGVRASEQYSPVEALVLLFGLLAGVTLSLLVISLWPVSTEALEKARELGVVSITILSGYPKAMEVHYYLIFLVITPLTTLIFWAVYRHVILSKREWDELDPAISAYIPPLRGRWFLLSALVALFLSFHAAYFESYWINDWYLFG
ncbi:MAG: hypothetical protein GY771_12360, partial [bacterium]|nr:hypothetical protein [bacterium]